MQSQNFSQNSNSLVRKNLTPDHIYAISTAGQITFPIAGGYTVGLINTYMNGSKLRNGTDYTATDGLNVVLTSSVTAGQEIEFELLTYIGVLPQVTAVNGRTGNIIIQDVDIPNTKTTTLANITVNGTVSGEIAIVTMAISCSVYDLLYVSSSGYNKAKADADLTIPCIGMCIETGTGARQVLKKGYVKNNAWTWTTGQLLYVSPGTAGLITSTLPSTTGNRIQIIGYAESATVIYFNPDYTFVQV
jgi:hypothetical protein